jgi:hypothetical protein
MATTRRAGRGGGRQDDATLRALDRMARAVSARPRPRAVARADLPPEIQRICTEYRRWRTLIRQAIDLIRRIPVVGPGVATALDFMVQILDAICGIR